MVDFAAHTARIIGRLGRTVTVTPSGQAAREVTGVFVNEPALMFASIEGSQPILRLTTVDADGIVHGDPVTIGGVAYTVTRHAPDAEAGDVVLTLDKAA